LFPEVILIQVHKNYGVPGGRNIGAANAKGEVLVFIDNDASLHHLALEEAVAVFQSDEKIAIAGFKILNAFTKKLDMSSWTYQKSRINDYEVRFDTYTFCGCAHAVLKNVFEEVGRYWDDFFWGSEEAELSLKVLRAGYRIIYEPKLIAYHRISEERRTANAKGYFYGFRNKLWFTWRYYPFWSALKATFVKIGAYLIKGVQKRCLMAILMSIVAACSKFYLLFQFRDRLDKRAWMNYKRLSYKGPAWQVFRGLFHKS
ncbi:MAG: glycosyltransferase, partial [Candidatus Omnitrophica bacterium]|nr:glycosyltransferase [Candidatus Omnitrophota bacterium]